MLASDRTVSIRTSRTACGEREGGVLHARDNAAVNEHAARNVMLVRAIEREDTARALISDSDRDHAGRAAAELARWSASERGEEASAELFIEKRAELLAGKVAERERGLASAARSLAWRPWIGVVLPVAAFAFGAFFQQVGDRQHINVLAFPLLTIVLWNLVVYGLVGARLATDPRGRRAPSALRAAVVNVARRGATRLRGTAGAGFASFLDDWSRASAPLLMARGGRVLHLSAALLALGAIVGLYVRGLVFEYRAGWESTFLEPLQVHAVLSFLLAPAAAALGQNFPTVSDIAALRWPGSPGENAARWIHWYALLVAVLVILPRLLLAGVSRWQERRWSRRFPLALDGPYFRRLLGDFSPHRVWMRVVPYSYTLDEASARGLEAVAKGLLGDNAEPGVRPVVPFGAEQSAAVGIEPTDRAVAFTAALFNLAATPESENHGAFLETLRTAVGDRLIALVDESPFKRRLGDQPAARDRLDERRSAWSAFCSAHRVTVAFVDLAAPDLVQLERDAEPVLAAAG